MITQAFTIIKNAKITWSCPWMNIEDIIYFNRNVMTYKIMHKLSPNTFIENTNQSLVSNLIIQEITKISSSLVIGLNIIKRVSITQFIKTGIIHLYIYVSCQH